MYRFDMITSGNIIELASEAPLVPRTLDDALKP